MFWAIIIIHCIYRGPEFILVMAHAVIAPGARGNFTLAVSRPTLAIGREIGNAHIRRHSLDRSPDVGKGIAPEI